MNKINNYFFYFNSYLSLIDHHCLDGRFLWMNHAYNSAGNLLWLSFEQLIKLLIIQNRIEKNEIETVVIKDKTKGKTNIKFNDLEYDFKTIHKILDSLFFHLEPQHKLDHLLKEFNENFSIDLVKHNDCLKKLKEYFNRRYVTNSGTSYDPKMINEIDEIFFKLRNNCSFLIPQSFIDEIIFRKKYNIQEPVPYFESVFYKNNFIEIRQYSDLIDKIPDGRIIAHNGIKFKEFPKEHYEYLVKKGYIIQLRWNYLKMKS